MNPNKPSDSDTARAFLQDFMPLEKQIASGVFCPVERMIVEFALTPRNIKQRERMAGLSFAWFALAYAPMKRHGLLPTNKSWMAWLERYGAAKREVLLQLC